MVRIARFVNNCRPRSFMAGLGLCVFLVALWPELASAQITDNRNFDANRLRITPGQEDVLNVYSGFMPGHLAWDAGLWLNYANDPVTLNVLRSDGRYDRFMSLLKDRADAHFIGSLALFEWVQIGLDIPVTFYQARRDDRVSESGLVENIPAGGLGDIGLTAKVRLLRADDHFVDLAFVPNLTLSTGQPRGAYLGERKLTGTAEFAVSKSFFNFTLAGNVAAKFREVVRDTLGSLSIEHELIARVGLRYDFEELLDVPLTLDGTWEGFTQIKDFFNERNSGGSEFLFGAGYEVGEVKNIPFKLFGGGGFGVNPGYSIPDYRVFFGVAVHKRGGDRDGDGIEDSRDQCVEEPEDIDSFEDANGCPDPDNDGDGVLDVDDRKPLQPEDIDGFEDLDGAPDTDNDKDGVLDVDDQCPLVFGPSEHRGCPDADGDGIPDASDQCPGQAEDQDGFEDTDGCEDPDNDQDGVVDTQDACRDEPGPVSNQGCPDADRDNDSVIDRLDNCPDVAGLPENNGCQKKQLVAIKGCKLDLDGKVYFESGRADIRSVSFPLLDNVVQVLTAQPQIKKLRVEGHTDSRGSASFNKTLSQSRATSVKNYFENKGIASGRLAAKGFGEDRPIDTNNTARGRENNRRVELIIDDCKISEEAGE